uniref:Exocyst complex component Sec6 n=1 Tax=Setaria digitata TaxID=48799 RepID=A0A915Q5K8_9BILA
MAETLLLDRSFIDDSEISEMETMEIRIREMMSNKETIAELLPSLNEYVRIKSKLSLCLHLLLDSANIVTDVKSDILDGKLFKAYNNFIKYEKCRNDLLELADSDYNEHDFITGYFIDVELMAAQIRDVIGSTLFGNAINSVRNGDNNENDDDDSRHVGFGDISYDTMQQILKIIEYDAKLDADNEMRIKKGLKGFLNRPRNWRNHCMNILADRLRRGIQEQFRTSTKQILENFMENNGCKSDVKNMRIEHDTAAYREELLAMRKYFQETQQRETYFSEILRGFLQAENVFEQASNHIANCNLLAALEKLLKAESVRFHLLAFAESHNDFNTIYKMLMPYYEPLEEIYAKFISEVKYYCNRSIDIMRGKNSETKRQLEIILRAVEIDEKVDKLYENNQFEISNRPHCWRKMVFKIVEERVQQRVEAFQIEDRKLNKNWVTRNLEICRFYIVEDLCAAKHFLRIFPKEHQLYNSFIMFYHNGISNKISEMAKGELNKRELIQLLSWIRQYPGEHMLGMKYLEIDAMVLVKDKPLIERRELLRLFELFIEIIKSETAKWASKTVQQEFADTQELCRNILEDEFGHYYTHLPHILYSIVNDQIATANNLDMCAASTEKLRKYIEEMVNEPTIWNGIRDQKRISTTSQSSNNTVAKQQHSAIHGAMSALKDIPTALANLAPSASENTLDEFNDNNYQQTEVELEDEEPSKAASEKIGVLKTRFGDMLRMVQVFLHSLQAIFR